MSDTKRSCRGCEGTGYQVTVGAAPYFMTGKVDCPVCLGSGQVGAKASVRDAMADAETLWIEATRWAIGAPKATALREARGTASMMLEEIAAYPAGGDLAWTLAEEAARAAFRAVPGLRG